MSKIPYCDITWNPLTGCSKYSEGCANCYAERLATGTWAALKKHYPNGFQITYHPERLTEEFLNKEFGGPRSKSKKIFVGNMTDLFHKAIEPEYFNRILDAIRRRPHHTFQMLTKRADRLGTVQSYPENIWLGVTVESPKYLDRIDHLAATDAKIKWVSIEPMLEPFIDYSWLKSIDWLVVGGESGPNRRHFDAQWARDFRAACADYNVAFWFKQHHGDNNTTDRLLDGERIEQWPAQKQTSLI